jgi:hypothetical protein
MPTPKQPAPLSTAELDKIRENIAVDTNNEQDALAAQVAFEAERDALAYQLLLAARKNKTNLPWGEAQAQATKKLKK